MGRYKEVNAGRDKEIESCSSCGGDGCSRCNNYGYFEVTYQLICNQYYDDYGRRSPSSDYDTEREISRRPVKKSGSSGGCFITTATLNSLRINVDNCAQLSVFRTFRDTYLAKKQDGPALIEKYYRIAPTIVSTIDDDNCRGEIYEWIYKTYLHKCYDLILKKEYQDAQNLYVSMVNDLEYRYV